MGVNALLELDENDLDSVNLSRGLSRYFGSLESALLFIIALSMLFLIWVGVMLWEQIARKVLGFLVPEKRSS
jgi:hypothetical protein